MTGLNSAVRSNFICLEQSRYLNASEAKHIRASWRLLINAFVHSVRTRTFLEREKERKKARDTGHIELFEIFLVRLVVEAAVYEEEEDVKGHPSLEFSTV